MKISLSYPPLDSPKGTPCLAQNRQFQWFSSATYIYPMIPASAATLLKTNGYEVFWDDAIAENLSYREWLERISMEKPDIIAIETKTPVIKSHWKIIGALKNLASNTDGWNAKIVLYGDHATALPEESFKESAVDFVIAGGDYDFQLLSIANHLSGRGELEKGIFFQSDLVIKNTGCYDPGSHSLDELPLIDRELTRWELYARKNGNFKHKPGSYMMSARDCWWGRCTFCSWTTMFPGHKFRARSAEKSLDEVGELIGLGVREIMEDSGSLPVGEWLQVFCQGMIERGYHKQVVMSCNMRLNGIKDAEVWRLMKKAGFRFILFGLESANQDTLDRLDKGLLIEEIEPSLKMCKEAGLEPHITTMIGYPWETEAEARKTISFTKSLFGKGLVNTLQATIVVPYPGTPLFGYCQDNGLFLTEDYDSFDQRQPVMKSGISRKTALGLTRQLYTSFMSPAFIIKKLREIRKWSDVKYLVKSAWKVAHHLKDFRN